MQYKTIENKALVVNYEELINDRDWVLSGDTATHFPCNGNTAISLLTYNIEANKNYTVSFVIEQMSDNPILKVGFETPIYTYTTPQKVNIDISSTDSNKKLTFWASGFVVIKVITIQSEDETPITGSEETIVYSEKDNRWVSFRSYQPEKGFSMFTDMFTYQNGQMRIHKNEDNRNLFYNTQYKTLVKFPVGAISVKNYQSVAIHSNNLMVTTTDGITTQLGHVSDLIETDFSTREGIHYANFLRDKITGMVNGDRLKGRYLIMELETLDGHKKLQLFKVITKSATSTPNE